MNNITLNKESLWQLHCFFAQNNNAEMSLLYVIILVLFLHIIHSTKTV